MIQHVKSQFFLILSLLLSFDSVMADTPEKHSLPPCPDKPNCVNSHALDEDHRIDPWPLDAETDHRTTMEKIVSIVDQTDRAKVVAQGERYLHAEFTSSIFGFTDDVEFLIDASNEVLHVRSASRKGYFDFGANRKRIKKLREAFYNEE